MKNNINTLEEIKHIIARSFNNLSTISLPTNGLLVRFTCTFYLYFLLLCFTCTFYFYVSEQNVISHQNDPCLVIRSFGDPMIRVSVHAVVTGTSTFKKKKSDCKTRQKHAKEV